jgi:hypothetical protein
MKKIVSALITGTVLATLSATCAFAAGSTSQGSTVLNGQVNLNTQWSNLNAIVDGSGSDVAVQGSAAGNLLDVTTMNDTRVNNSQIVGSQAAIGSDVNTTVSNVWGNVSVGNQAVCNGAGISTDPTLTKVKSYQECNATDPASQINLTASGVAGNIVAQSATLGNSFEADSNAPHMPITTNQINTSVGASTVNAHLTNVGGAVGLSSSAVGNSAQIIHYATN